MKRIVLDTNVVVSGMCSREGASYQLLLELGRADVSKTNGNRRGSEGAQSLPARVLHVVTHAYEAGGKLLGRILRSMHLRRPLGEGGGAGMAADPLFRAEDGPSRSAGGVAVRQLKHMWVNFKTAAPAEYAVWYGTGLSRARLDTSMMPPPSARPPADGPVPGRFGARHRILLVTPPNRP